jgi:hypothetical protein
VTGYNYATVAEIPDMVNQWAPGADIEYDNGILRFKDKDGVQQQIDIRGIDGKDGEQVVLQKNGDEIQWRYTSDTAWHDLINLSDLAGADGKSVDIGVISMSGIKNALVWKKEGETNSDWRFLYNLDDINGVDGCGVRAEKTSTEIGTTVTLLKDCPGQQGHGDVLVSFDVLNGAKGTVDEQQIIEALEQNGDFMQLRQLKNKVNDPSTGLESTYNLVVDLYDRVDHEKTGLAATNTLANDAWDKVKDLDYGVTAKSYVNSRIGELGIDNVTHREFEDVAAKIGDVGYTNTVKDYIDAAVAGVNTNIKVRQGRDGYTYICKTGNNCTGEPDVYSDEWARISVDVSGYLKKGDADGYYASIAAEGVANTAQTTATEAKTRANDAWAKLEDLGNNVTVKSYVDDYVSNMVGNLGIDYITGEKYTVRGKIGNFPGTVQDYIDTKVAGVNTTIQVAQHGGQTYICKKGNNCATPAGPYYPEDWAQITVDVSGYLTENDADKLYAPVGTVATANEAKTAATAAQQTATQAQSTATAAQSTANDAWGKLNGLSGTVKEYVDDKVGSAGSTINVQTVNGVTYICRTGTCLDTPPSAYWAPIEVNISDEYLTETEGNALYALKSDIGTLGGSFSSVADKIGLNNSNDWTNSNKSVKQYVDDKISNLSTNIQIETSNGTTYICKQGSGCPTYDLTNTTYWAPVAVNLGELGTNPTTQRTYTVAEKIGLTGTNSSKQVVGYIGDRIGDTGTDYYTGQQKSVVSYLADTYVPLTKLGTEITNNTTQTVVQYITQRIGETGTIYDSYSGQSRPKTVVEFLAGNYVPLSTIGDLGSATYGGIPYTVAQKIGLTDSNSSKTVVQYIGEKIGSLGSGYQSVAAKLGSIGETQTVTDYIQSYVAQNTTSINVKPGGDGYTYICTGSNCTSYATHPEDDAYSPTNPNGNWTRLNVNLSYIDNILAGFGSGEGKIATVKGYVDDKIGTLGKVNASTNAASVAEKLGTDITGAEKTVAQYIYDKIGDMGWYNNGSYNVYYNVASKIGDIGSPQTVKGYVDNAIGGLSGTYATKSTETVASEAQSTANAASETANDAWDRVSNLGKINDDTYATSVATKIGEIGNKTVKQYVDDKVATVKPTIMTETYQGTTYICSSGNCVNHAPDDGWEELSVNLSALDDIEAILAGFGETGEPPTVMSYIGDMGGYNDVANYNTYTPYTVASKIGLNSGDDASKTVKQYVDTNIQTVNATLGDKADKTMLDDYATLSYIGNLGDGYDTVKEYIDEHTPTITVKEGADGNSYICTGSDCTGTPPGDGWTKLNVDLTSINTAITNLQNNKADESALDNYALKTDIGTLGTPSGSETPYTVQTKIGAIPSDKTIKEYIDNKTPSITVRNGNQEGTTNNLYICTKASCDDSVIPGDSDSGWMYLDIASAVDLTAYLQTADLPTQLGQTAEVNAIKSAVSTELDNKLNKSNIELKREDDKIMISGGGISTPYEVAKVSDFMCASYRMEEIESDDPAYQADKTSFRLVCETVSEDDND